MMKLPIYSSTKLMLAFEYGLTISEVAKQNNVQITPELVKRAEEIILKEFREKTSDRVAIDMIPNILAVFQPSDTIKEE